MNTQIQEFIGKYNLFRAKDSLLLALSGGKDSMALLHYLNKQGNKIQVAHCNFQLRGEESDEDAAFIKSYCKEQNIPCHILSMDTQQLANERGIAIQEAAREIRYAFLEEKRLEIKAQYILTAHHLQDNIETLWFKIAKGTGIKGLRGVEPKNGKLVRPFLETNVEDIISYVKAHSIPYREDSSNVSVKYSRNKIRHELTPVLKDINPQLDKTMLKHFDRWREMAMFYNVMLENARKEFFEHRNGAVYIAVGKMIKLPYRKSLLFGILEPYGFNNSDIEDVFKSIDKGNEVKEFNSSSHKLIKDRKFLILEDLQKFDEHRVYLIDTNTAKLDLKAEKSLFINQKPIDKVSKLNKGDHHCYIDADTIDFPLILRKWESGDYFYPIGMYKENGKRSKKNIGKFLRDLKTDARKKEQTWVLSTSSKIVWVLGFRADDRFKVTDKTKMVLHLSLK